MKRRSFFLTAAYATPLFGVCAPAHADMQCGPIENYQRSCTTGIKSEHLDLSIGDVIQHKEQWCWAACISMIFKFHQYSISQERVVTDAWGVPANMPGQPADILNSINRRWTDDNGRSFTARGKQVGKGDAARELQENRPLILGTKGHAVILTSMNYDVRSDEKGRVRQATVRDPWPGRGKRVLSAEEWRSIGFLSSVLINA